MTCYPKLNAPTIVITARIANTAMATARAMLSHLIIGIGSFLRILETDAPFSASSANDAELLLEAMESERLFVEDIFI